MNLENLSLAELVTAKPEAAALLEKYNLDFCCRGKQKLSDALSKDPLKLFEVRQQLEIIFENKTVPEIDFEHFSLTQLIDFIVENHHRYVKENLPIIEQHLEKVSMKHGESHPEMKTVAELFSNLKADFEQHMVKEEIILFPRIKKIESLFSEGISKDETIILQDPIQMMEHEHEEAGKIMEEIKSLCNHYTPPINACTTFRLSLDELKHFEHDLHRHVHLENNILFPKAMAMQKQLNLIL